MYIKHVTENKFVLTISLVKNLDQFVLKYRKLETKMLISIKTLLNFVLYLMQFIMYISAVNVNITVFAPILPKTRLFALEKVQTAVEIAIQKVEASGIRGHNLNVSFVSSNASEIDVPVAAFKLMNKGVRLFIGPVYDYGLAAIARYAPKWNVAVISPGGFADGFKHKKNFKTLTRVHTTFDSMAAFIYKILQYYKWTKLKAISEKFGRNDIYKNFCDLAITAVHQKALYKRNLEFEKYDILREEPEKKATHVLEKIGTKFAGKLSN